MKSMGWFVVGMAISLIFLTTDIFAASVVKVDFDMSGRNSSEVTEPNYVPWVVSGVSSKDTTISGVKIKVAKGSAGSNLKANWYKVSVQSPSYAKLVGDGIIVEDGNSGGEISLTFSNLAAGTHSLLTYLNNVDDLSSTTYSNIDVYVNGTKQVTVKPSVRALSTADAATAYVTFNVSGTSASTVITFKPGTSATFKNVTLNGFELDVPNAAAQANSPSPSDFDMHAPHDNGSLTLSWAAAKSAVKHQVYFGADSAAVESATTSTMAL